jgi:hypothetical protein
MCHRAFPSRRNARNNDEECSFPRSYVPFLFLFFSLRPIVLAITLLCRDPGLNQDCIASERRFLRENIVLYILVLLQAILENVLMHHAPTSALVIDLILFMQEMNRCHVRRRSSLNEDTYIAASSFFPVRRRRSFLMVGRIGVAALAL